MTSRRAAACVALVAAMLAAAPAGACRCRPLTLEAYYQQADIVLLAEIVAVTTATPSTGDEHRVARFRILDQFKGSAGAGHLRTPTSSAACGIPIEAGEQYWVFSKRQAGEADIWIDSCNGSRPNGSDFMDTQGSEVANRLRQLASVAGQQGASKPFTDPACWSKPRRYHTGTPPTGGAQEIRLVRVENTAADFDGTASPNGAYALKVQSPRGNPPTGIATVTIEIERDYRLQLRLQGVAAPPDAEWINEKLIFIRVAWDSVISTDIILDVEDEKLVYVEGARSGNELFESDRGECEPH